LNAIEVDNNMRAFNWGRVAAVDPEKIPCRSGPWPRSDEGLENIINRRAEFLVGYQNQNLADRYLALLQRVRDTEYGDDALVEAVAKSYFKLLSYKDEYEVARLHTQTGFLDGIRRDFGNKAKLRFHMAPPLFSHQKDARGRPRKKEIGAWIIPALRLLASLRGLRGTWFDLFGMTAERRMERALIAEFEALIENGLAELTAASAEQLRVAVALYMDVRGYGLVKEQAVQELREKLASS
jgi:indolepyruvate ferredoxin oxidoreductase